MAEIASDTTISSFSGGLHRTKMGKGGDCVGFHRKFVWEQDMKMRNPCDTRRFAKGVDPKG
jgi:hypothetical protein